MTDGGAPARGRRCCGARAVFGPHHAAGSSHRPLGGKCGLGRVHCVRCAPRRGAAPAAGGQRAEASPLLLHLAGSVAAASSRRGPTDEETRAALRQEALRALAALGDDTGAGGQGMTTAGDPRCATGGTARGLDGAPPGHSASGSHAAMAAEIARLREALRRAAEAMDSAAAPGGGAGARAALLAAAARAREGL